MIPGTTADSRNRHLKAAQALFKGSGELGQFNVNSGLVEISTQHRIGVFATLNGSGSIRINSRVPVADFYGMGTLSAEASVLMQSASIVMQGSGNLDVEYPVEWGVIDSGLSRQSTLSIDDTPRGFRVGVAIDITNRKLWAYNTGNGLWNNSIRVNQDPGTNTGGASLTIEPGNAIFPAWSGNGANNVTTIYVDQLDFILDQAMPAGFEAWGNGCVWDSSHKSAQITLSNSDKTATWVGPTGSWESVLGSIGYVSGKRYFELDVGNFSTNGWIGGIANLGLDLSNYIGSDSGTGAGVQVTGTGYGGAANIGVCWKNTQWDGKWRSGRASVGKSTGKWYWECIPTIVNNATKMSVGFAGGLSPLGGYLGQYADGSIGFHLSNAGKYERQYNGTTTAMGSAIGINDVIGLAVDVDARLVWIWNPDDGKWNNDAAANPATGTGGISIPLISYPIYPAVSLSGSAANRFTARFKKTDFTLSVPDGFTAFDPLDRLPFEGSLFFEGSGSLSASATIPGQEVQLQGSGAFAALAQLAMKATETVVGSSSMLAAATVLVDYLYWDPSFLSNLVGWWDADDATTLTDAGSGHCSQWNDKSTNANHVTQTTDGNRPIITAGAINGRTALVFTASSNQYLEKLSTTGLPSTTTGFSFAAVAELDQTSTCVFDVSNSSTTTNRTCQLILVSPNDLNFRNNGVSGAFETNYNDLVNPNVFSGDMLDDTPDASHLWVSGTASSNSGSSIATQTSDHMRFGRQFQNVFPLQGKIAEIVFVSGVISTENRQRLEGYLAWKWGRESSLPVGHPWVSRAPRYFRTSAAFGGQGSMDTDATVISPLFRGRGDVIADANVVYAAAMTSAGQGSVSANARIIPVIEFLTTTGANTWTVPSDWNNSNNTIEVIGGGGSGGLSAQNGPNAGTGGGGGAYSKITNLTLTPSSSVDYTIGTGGTAVSNLGTINGLAGNAGGDSWFNGTSLAGSSVGAKGGGAGQGNNTASVNGGTGGDKTLGVGTTKNSGGRGGNMTSSGNQCATGGGGAGGPNGDGNNGVDRVGGSHLGTNGGAGDAGSGGTAGTAGVQGGAVAGNGGAGGDSSARAGGGGGGQPYNNGLALTGGTGGNYGAGGGGAGAFTNAVTNTTGAGKQGVIKITYTPSS